MLKGLYTAHTGMINEQHRMDTLTNNLANAATVGYKKEGATSQSFGDLLAVKIKDRSVGSRIVQPLGFNNPGVKIGENYTDFTQGSYRITDNTYDLALSGDGFFVVEFTNKAGETSTMYTRAGQFTLTREGDLVTTEGDYVLDTNNNHIRLNTLADTVIDQNGTIYQNGVPLTTIQVADFEDYNYLAKYGESYYYPVEGAQFTPSEAVINQGYLEMSNVQVVSEMVNMIAVTRAYESNQKIIQTYDSSLEIAVSQLGRVQ